MRRVGVCLSAASRSSSSSSSTTTAWHSHLLLYLLILRIIIQIRFTSILICSSSLSEHNNYSYKRILAPNKIFVEAITIPTSSTRSTTMSTLSAFQRNSFYYYPPNSRKKNRVDNNPAACAIQSKNWLPFDVIHQKQQNQFYDQNPSNHAFVLSSHVPRLTDSVTTTNNKNNIILDADRCIILDPLIVCGPSGVGKGTIIDQFMNVHGGQNEFAFTVSHTTRSPRVGEINGIHYHFVSHETMHQLIQTGTYFLEYAQVHNNYYGTSWQALFDVQQQQQQQQQQQYPEIQAPRNTAEYLKFLDSNRNNTNNKNYKNPMMIKKRAILDIDVQGVQRIKQIQKEQQEQKQISDILFQPKYIFIAPPSMEVLQQRLVHRGTESSETLHTRLANAQSELEYGYTDGNFDTIIINQHLPTAVSDFCKAVKQLYS